MQEIAKRLAEFQPDEIDWTISLAYATPRADSTQAAKKFCSTRSRSFQKLRR
jgi:hypothetical protein